MEGEGLRNKTILITGGTGTFGVACVQELIKTGIGKIRVFSRDEKKQWDMAQEIKDDRIVYFLGDIRDKERLERGFTNVDYIIHAAALKQVPALEYNPIEAIKTNILGTQNVINAAIDRGVSKVLMLSSDKAVNPINLYGATKLCAEKLIVNSNVYSKTRLSVVRYGNVEGSRGSVIELFNKQKTSGCLTITDENMTRFWLTPDEAVQFVLKCLFDMRGGEIFIPKLKKVKIKDIASAICPECEIKVIGKRIGEKMHEKLISFEESPFAHEKDDCFIIHRENKNNKLFEYTSS